MAERKKWLVALGSAKACLTDSRTQRKKEFLENTENLKIRMLELRLYCDLLVQQVDKTKEVATAGVTDSEVKHCFSDVTDTIHKGSVRSSMGIYSPVIAVFRRAWQSSTQKRVLPPLEGI